MKQQKLSEFPVSDAPTFPGIKSGANVDNMFQNKCEFSVNTTLDRRKKLEVLRTKGQFWTPSWVAEAMVSYLFAGGKKIIFDPCVGAGAFFQAAKNISDRLQQKVTLKGTEIDHNALMEAGRNGLSERDLEGVEVRDFLLEPPLSKFEGVIANPPYIRHHRLSSEVKNRLQKYALEMIGEKIDGRAGYHVYFLMKGLELLNDNGRLVFILPADTCEGKFAPVLWKWITENYCLDAVVTFSHGATPFPKQDTNPVIVMIRKAKPRTKFMWAQCKKRDDKELTEWVLSGFTVTYGAGLEIHERTIVEAMRTGLSRLPQNEIQEGKPLGEFARVIRGIATGANVFFFMTRGRARELKIPDKFLLSAIGKTRDIVGNVITVQTLEKLDAEGKPTLLLSLGGTGMDGFPEAVCSYLKSGEEAGIPKKILISKRKPWYKMEVRKAPPFLFSYLGRKHVRFVRNEADVVPLTGFLCVYPNSNSRQHLSALEKALNHPKTLENLKLVGKSYGGGAVKVEPRQLEKLLIPKSVLVEAGIVSESKAHGFLG